MKIFLDFLTDQDGAVTIEWVTLSAGATMMALGIVALIAPSLEASGGNIAAAIPILGDDSGSSATATPLTCTNGYCRDGGGNIVGFTDGNNFAPSDGNGSFHNPVPIADSGYSLSGTTPSGASL